jgi:sulfide:quinone oxidoreductase
MTRQRPLRWNGDIATPSTPEKAVSMPTLNIPRPGHPGRRTVLRGLAGAAALGVVTRPIAQSVAPTAAHVVIVGSGAGGVSLANRLSQSLPGAKITVIDKREVHHYQPGYTLVATGIWKAGEVLRPNAELLPSGLDWIREMATEIDPESNTVTTDTGRKIRYDFLVVATGLHLDYAAIQGMDPAAIGSHGIGSVYNGHEAAAKTWQAIAAFRERGGEALMTLPATPLKCAGAPLKMTFLVVDRLRQAGTLARSKVTFESALGNVFGVPEVNDDVLRRWKALDVGVEFNRRLAAIDIGARRATFVSPEGERTERGYDFIHVVPPMRATDVVRSSPLCWKEGPFAAGGWLEVDRSTLRHRRYPNVFGIGDINGTPRGKTAATVKKSAPVVAENLVAVVAGKEPVASFDGYTSCPLIVRDGSALLIEFDYDGKLTPSMPLVEPLQDSYMAWLLKYRLLKPAYYAVLAGRV